MILVKGIHGTSNAQLANACNTSKHVIVWFERLYIIDVFHRRQSRPKIFITLAMPNLQMHACAICELLHSFCVSRYGDNPYLPYRHARYTKTLIKQTSRILQECSIEFIKRVGESNKMRGLSSKSRILLLFRNEFNKSDNTGEQM